MHRVFLIPAIITPLQKINKTRKHVVTSTINSLHWQNLQKISGGVLAAQILQFKQLDGPLLQVHGSWQLIQLLISKKLIDEFRLWTFPVTVGSGKRLFSKGIIPSSFKLIKFEACPSGAFMSFYQQFKGAAV